MRKLAGKALCWGSVGLLCVASVVGAFGLVMSGYGKDLSR